MQTNDFGALTPNPSSSQLGVFDATPYADSSTLAGVHVWVGCVTTNTVLGSVGAHGLRDAISAGHTLALSDVNVGLVNALGGKLNGGSAGCVITAGQQTAGACPLPVAGSEETLLTEANAGTTELDWQYQLDLPANQPVGVYSGGEVVFTATAGTPEPVSRAPANTVAPTIVGVAGEGLELDASTGRWSESPTSFAYQWQDCNASGGACVAIVGATSSSLDLAARDVSHTVRVVVSASNAAGSEKASSAATAVVIASQVSPDNVEPPTVSGTAVEGETLQTSAGAWTGSPTTFAYQWQDCDGSGEDCLDISGADTSKYKLSSIDVGNTVRVVVTATGAGGVGRASSRVTATVHPQAPKSTALPTVSGSTVEGQTLSAGTGTWSASPTSYSYQWEDCNASGGACVAIAGVIASSYELTATDVGHTLRVSVTASNAGGSTSASSNATAKVAALPAVPVNTVLPSISPASLQEATAAHASTGTWANNPTTFSYQWERCEADGSDCAPIASATASSYTPTEQDVAHALVVLVSATNSQGTSSAESPPSSAVLPADPKNTAIPQISGSAFVVGVPLSTSTGTWSGDPTSYSYQWQHCGLGENPCSDIAGATSSTYTPTAAVVGTFVRVIVTATNEGGSSAVNAHAVGKIVASLPVNTVAPELSNSSPIDGVAISVSSGTWSASPTSFTYQWERCEGTGENCSSISGATTATYTPAAADVAHALLVVVKASNSGGSGVAASPASSPVGQLPSDTSAPALSTASPTAGTQLSVSTGSWSGYPSLFTYSYQWLRCESSGLNCKSIPAATSSTYTPSQSDGGFTLQAQVTATNTAGQAMASSAVSAAVTAAPVNIIPPEISTQIPVEHVAITTTEGSWNGYPTIFTYTYQWLRCDSNGENCAAIAGANGSSYTPTEPASDYTLRTEVTAKNSAGSTVALSPASGLVVHRPPANVTLPTTSLASPDQAVSVTASTGTWANQPTSYAYQWERCNAAATECSNISGATHSTYTPTEADVEHPLLITVTATNDGGSTSASSNPTNKVKPVGQVSEFATIGTGQPWAITAGPDGNLWYTMQNGGEIEKITPAGAVSEYAGVEGAAQPRGITSGPDGNLWITEFGLRRIGKMSTSGVMLSTFTVELSAEDIGITAGPDGNLWYVGYESDKVTKITTAGTFTAFSLPSGAEPYGIATGADGNLWFTEEGAHKIGKITTAGTITEYTLPTGSEPRNITLGPDGNMWFTEFGTNKIGKITTTGTITEYALASESGPEGITVGSDENIWFTDLTSGKIGRISTSGAITTYSLPSTSQPRDIALGSDSNLWFAEYGTKKIGKIAP